VSETGNLKLEIETGKMNAATGFEKSNPKSKL
jgi:hypothetical protein